MNYEVRVVDSINEVDAAEWQKLTANRPFSSQRWYQFAEEVVNEQPHYFLLYRSGELVGFAAADLQHRLNATLTSPLARTVTRSILRRYPVLLCQRPIANMNGFVLPEGDELNAIQALNKAMQARRYRSSFIALGYLSEADHQTLAPSGAFQFVRMDNNTILPITWSTFDDYLKLLTAAGHRSVKSMKQNIEKARQLGISIELTHQFSQHADRLVELVGNVFAQYHSESENYATRRFFSVIERELPENCTMALAWINGVLAGCGLLLHDQGVMRQSLLGLDYSYKYIYFQTFYTEIRFAIENGIKEIYSGTGAYDIKRRMGFQEVPAYIAFTSPQPILRWLGNRLAQNVRMTQSRAVPDRAPVQSIQ